MTQIKQINSIMANISTIKRLLDEATTDVKRLEREHYQADELEPVYRPIFNAVIELRHALPALREFKGDAAIADSISADDGMDGIQKMLARFDKKATSHIAQTAKKDARKTTVKGGK